MVCAPVYPQPLHPACACHAFNPAILNPWRPAVHRFEPKELGFRPWTLQDMASADTREIEAFLTVIYRAIASAAPLKDKVNVLSYFETLCTDTNTANLLINSSLTVLFIRLLKNAKAPLLRIRLASVLGLLVRHATFIQVGTPVKKLKPLLSSILLL